MIAARRLSLFSSKQCIIKQLLHSVFVISGMIKVSVSVISLSLRLRLITLTSTLIIPDITKTSSNNCFLSKELRTIRPLYYISKSKKISTYPAAGKCFRKTRHPIIYSSKKNWVRISDCEISQFFSKTPYGYCASRHKHNAIKRQSYFLSMVTIPLFAADCHKIDVFESVIVQLCSVLFQVLYSQTLNIFELHTFPSSHHSFALKSVSKLKHLANLARSRVPDQKYQLWLLKRHCKASGP